MAFYQRGKVGPKETLPIQFRCYNSACLKQTFTDIA